MSSWDFDSGLEADSCFLLGAVMSRFTEICSTRSVAASWWVLLQLLQRCQRPASCFNSGSWDPGQDSFAGGPEQSTPWLSRLSIDWSELIIILISRAHIITLSDSCTVTPCWAVTCLTMCTERSCSCRGPEPHPQSCPLASNFLPQASGSWWWSSTLFCAPQTLTSSSTAVPWRHACGFTIFWFIFQILIIVG